MIVSDLTANLSGYYRWHAHIYDLTRWTFLFGRTGLIRLASKHIAPPRRILEIGCGTGSNLVLLARTFPAAEIVGLDLSAEMLKKAQQNIARFGGRVSLLHRSYSEPLANGSFDLIVISYCLSMMNPGFAEALRICRQDLSPSGTLAIVDFHDTRAGWFRRWMRFNHARLEGQILEEFERSGMHLDHLTVRRAYGGLWLWFTCLASIRARPEMLG
jgi:S-adenosylmethionine-diacylgycerolhomoserine-N-methlytransferase